MTVTTDERGRLYLPKELRERYGQTYHVLEYEDHIELIPVSDDPLKSLRENVGRAIEGQSIEELREAAIEQAHEDAGEHAADR
jgi:bifunctional DNA-binding transcriptional regulator/antitoxin component of YhaV-PrlF toxin-antitoxin module